MNRTKRLAKTLPAAALLAAICAVPLRLSAAPQPHRDDRSQPSVLRQMLTIEHKESG